ncbi:NYN domain-containing protein [Mycolicibacterium monacense]|uniref:RNA-binding protein n=2 Tax=Mycobacteriaceae TaxID=1762 RepID=A0AAD1IUX6_MYCMB|nr:NYN domain-containing protein [Mycolicibacterium monacense]MDA4100586.1 RNA-binding protein [Mycolicibacterium monacense DSM 44395]QHP85719.1 RNA-binding protein [Mycolicibacterium monacense DSM 44395]BBZ61369.1 RNA-binding protein [Mycolicibacterium monacense]
MRWIVDGMNVIGCRPDGWWRDRRGAMTGLVLALERWAVAEGAEVSVVFEKPLTPTLLSDAVTVTHAPAAAPNSADDEIVRMVRAADDPGEIVVATSDRALGERVRAAGAATYPAERLRNDIDPR